MLLSESNYKFNLRCMAVDTKLQIYNHNYNRLAQISPQDTLYKKLFFIIFFLSLFVIVLHLKKPIELRNLFIKS